MRQVINVPAQKWDGSIAPDAGYEYALVYMYSEMCLLPFSKWQDIDPEECLEARLFSPAGELHLFREGDVILVSEIREPGGKNDGDIPAGAETCTFDVIDRIYPIRKNCRALVPGRSRVIVREYISYDGDGQAYTARTRLVDLR